MITFIIYQMNFHALDERQQSMWFKAHTALKE